MTTQAEVMKAWQCIGCGRIDGPQTCVGICQNQKVDLVYAHDYEALRKQLDEARATIGRLAAQIRFVVNTRPRNAAWESSYKAMQDRMRKALANLPADAQRDRR